MHALLRLHEPLCGVSPQEIKSFLNMFSEMSALKQSFLRFRLDRDRVL